MIFVKITDGSNTLYCCDTKSKLCGTQGFEKDSQFYKPSLLNQPKFSHRGKNWIAISNTTIQIDREDAKVFTGEEVNIIVWLWDEGSATSKFIIFDGVGIRGKFNSVYYEYRLEESDHGLKDDLLSPLANLETIGYYYTVTTATSGASTITVGETIAPPEASGTLTIGGDDYSYTSFAAGVFTISGTLSQTYTDNFLTVNNTKSFTDERLEPMYFGYLKHVTPMLLAVSCVATGCSTADSTGDTNQTAQYDGGQSVNYEQVGEVALKTGSDVVYSTTIDIDATATIDGSETGEIDSKPYGVVQSLNGDATDATRLTINGGFISDQSGVGTTTRTSYAIEDDGQSHWYVYNTGTNQWDEVATIGISSAEGDSLIFQADNHGEAFIPLYAKSSNNSLSAGTFLSTGTSNAAIEARARGTNGIGLSVGSLTGNALVTGFSADTGNPIVIVGNSTKGHGFYSTGITSDPSSPVEGTVYYNSSTKKWRGYNGTTWTDFN